MSFSEAAEQLGYAQSTVTMQISQLERELGVSLFDRSGKRFHLNAKGEELLEYANRITALAAEAKTNVSDFQTPKGLLRIGVIESVGAFFLPDILRDYLICFPQVQVQVLTATTRIIMEMLRQNKIDLMLTLDNMVYDPDWECVWSRPEDIVFLCAPCHPFANRVVSLPEVVEENLLLTEQRCNYRQTFEQICMERHLQLRSSLEIGCTNTILNFTQHNLGISFLPELTAQEVLNKGTLASFEIADVKIKMFIQLIYRKSKWCTPAMQAFIARMRAHHERASESFISHHAE
jgi:DNA-binding transcriptional LysR family regulator